MTYGECKIGMSVRAVKDLAPGFWATGLILGRIVGFAEPFVTVKCISHRRKDYEGDNLCCDPEHLVHIFKAKGVGVNNSLTALFDT